MYRAGKWVIAGVGAVVLVAAVDFCASATLHSAKVSRALTARLTAAFGRPVQVSRYDFSLWGGPRIEADSVTVGEDPRFGHEYFLRAPQVVATLRWTSLLRGRIAFGTFTLEQPSLNVVTANGRWNLADWLPHPPAGVGRSGARSATPLLYRIDVDEGRIDFKRGSLKLPFALVDVTGRVDESGPGLWSISLDAQPLRAAVNLQDAGTLRLVGRVGGTSVRLRPASLELQWEDASLSDVLRLLAGSDYGIRGRQDVDFRASSTGADWNFELDAHDRDVHRWDLVSQPSNPGLNVRLAGDWSPGAGLLRITGGRVEAPHSFIAIAGQAHWPVGAVASSSANASVRDIHIHLSSAGLGMQDVLSWYRSFHPRIAPSLEAGGWLQGSLDLDGWPPRVVSASLAGDGLRVEGAPLSSPVSLSRASFLVGSSKVALSLRSLDFGPRIGEFQLSGAAQRGRDRSYLLQADGSTLSLAALARSLQALGARPLGYWNEFTGPAKIQLQWSGRLSPLDRHVRASVDFHDALWQEPSLPARVQLGAASARVTDSTLRIDVSRADALGATWSGWLQRSRSSGAWQFDLKTGTLDARALVARLRPQPERPGLLERIFGFGRSAAPRASWLATLDASGRLGVRRVVAASLGFDSVQGQLAIHDGALDFTSAQARLSGGNLRGAFRLSVADGQPAWQLNARLDGVQLAGISRAFAGARPAPRFSGIASGTLHLAARGSTAAALRDSLSGAAQLALNSARDSRIDWLATLDAGHLVAGSSSFRSVTAALDIAAGKIAFKDLVLASPLGRVEAAGGVDFAHGGILAVDARFLAGGRARNAGLVAARTFQITGNPATPLIRSHAPVKQAAAPQIR